MEVAIDPIEVLEFLSGQLLQNLHGVAIRRRQTHFGARENGIEVLARSRVFLNNAPRPPPGKQKQKSL